MLFQYSIFLLSFCLKILLVAKRGYWTIFVVKQYIYMNIHTNVCTQFQGGSRFSVALTGTVSKLSGL